MSGTLSLSIIVLSFELYSAGLSKKHTMARDTAITAHHTTRAAIHPPTPPSLLLGGCATDFVMCSIKHNPQSAPAPSWTSSFDQNTLEKSFKRQTANLFQSRSVLDAKNRLTYLQHLPLPELGENTSDCLAGGPDGLSDLFVVQSQLDGP